ncbi:MAG: protein tyrosine phosphatase [Candidatus Rokubacteria bacterium]|nr:protein tyrosine phosphatase [Candidatus Rokubacteria bacterium]
MNFLFVCTANVSRSPAAEAVFRQITNGTCDTRSAGISRFCPRPLSAEDVRWADVVAVMEWDHRAFIVERWPEAAPKLRVLEIEDRYHRHDPVLLHLLEVKLGTLLAEIESGGMIGS